MFSVFIWSRACAEMTGGQLWFCSHIMAERSSGCSENVGYIFTPSAPLFHDLRFLLTFTCVKYHSARPSAFNFFECEYWRGNRSQLKHLFPGLLFTVCMV